MSLPIRPITSGHKLLITSTVQCMWYTFSSFPRAFPPVADKVDKVTYTLSGPPYPPSEIRKRALRYVDKENYNLVTRNCEHFATWCVYGNGVSGNVRAAVMGTGTAATTATGATIGAVVGGGVGSVVPVAGTFVGAVVGGAIGSGVGLAVGAAGSAVGWVVNQVAQSDKEEERFN